MRNRKPNVSNRKVLCSECKDLGSILPLAGRDATEFQVISRKGQANSRTVKQSKSNITGARTE
jgi:hypothetical protein